MGRLNCNLPGLGYMFEKIWMVWLRFALKLSISNLTNFSSAINGYTKTRFDLNFSAAGAYRCESGVGDFDKMEILTCVQICNIGLFTIENFWRTPMNIKVACFIVFLTYLLTGYMK